MTEETGKEPKVIKRYTNRKLYDTTESRYVTLDEIAEMVKQGTEVSIIDNRTKEDLTSVTLAQIVFEEEKKRNQLSLKTLREIIRHPSESIESFLSTQVSPRVESLKNETAHRIDKILGRDGDEASLLQQSQRAVEAWQSRVDDRVKTVVESVLGNIPALGRDVDSLVKKIDELEKRIVELEARPPKKS